MKNGKKEYKRSYKNLVACFLFIALSALSTLLNCFGFYYWFSGNRTLYYVFAAVGMLATVIACAALVFLLMSRFNKFTSEEVISNLGKKGVFAAAVLAFTIISSIAQCCICWGACCR